MPKRLRPLLKIEDERQPYAPDEIEQLRLEIKIKDNALASALQASAVALQAKDAEIRRLQADLARAREGTAKPIAVPVPVSSPAARAPAAHERALAQPRAPRQQSATYVSKASAWEYSGYIRGPSKGRGADHRAHGFGVCRYLDGQSYEGEYRDDLFHGKGKHCYANGEVYEGEYEHGLKHGQGKYTWPDGAVFTGEFRKDKMTERGKWGSS